MKGTIGKSNNNLSNVFSDVKAILKGKSSNQVKPEKDNNYSISPAKVKAKVCSQTGLLKTKKSESSLGISHYQDQKKLKDSSISTKNVSTIGGHSYISSTNVKDTKSSKLSSSIQKSNHPPRNVKLSSNLKKKKDQKEFTKEEVVSEKKLSFCINNSEKNIDKKFEFLNERNDSNTSEVLANQLKRMNMLTEIPSSAHSFISNLNGINKKESKNNLKNLIKKKKGSSIDCFKTNKQKALYLLTINQ